MSTKYYTYKKNVPLKPGEKIGYLRGKGYFARAMPHPTEDRLSLARNVAFFATVTDDNIAEFCKLPKTWKAAFTADPAYPVSDAQIYEVKASGHKAFAWCDCRTTLPPETQRWATYRGLAGWYGQAESQAEFTVAIMAQAPVVIGNLSTLDSVSLGMVARGGPPLFINETYYNVQPNLKPDWRNANAGVGGNCWACYASESEGAVYTPVDARFNKQTDSIYTEGMLAADWANIA